MVLVMFPYTASLDYIAGIFIVDAKILHCSTLVAAQANTSKLLTTQGLGNRIYIHPANCWVNTLPQAPGPANETHY